LKLTRRSFIVLAALGLSAGACQKPHYSEAAIEAARRDCIAEGFDPGTTEFANCESELLQDHAE
jgi:hypothetical protein